MKKYFYLASAAVLALASCSSEDYVGGENPNGEKPVAIAFGGNSNAVTRADKGGKDAADLLGDNYIVQGVKGNGTFTGYNATNTVFDHYNVNYVDGSDGSTTSNTKGWEYVAQTPNSSWTSVTQQTIKYWDYATAQYDFVAFSFGTSNSTDLTWSGVDVTKIGSTTDPVYTVKGSATDLTKAYVADLVTVYNPAITDQPTYQDIVTPQFRNMGSKVRMAIFETIPGYAVKDVKFYEDGSTTTAASTAVLYSSSKTIATGDGTMEVYYETVGSGNVGETDYNKAHIVFTADDADTEMSSVLEFPSDLKYTTAETGVNTTAHGTAFLGTSSPAASYATATDAAAAYQTVLPTGTGNALTLRVDYTLVPTDGGKETIVVHNATATVPAEYTAWEPNYAYTYIFKISQNSNGQTGTGTTPAGLYPITFDAVVMDDLADGIQETITTVATPSITTYAKGVEPTATAEYSTGKNIYVSLEDPSTTTLTDANTALYTATIEGGAAQTINEESVANAIVNGALVVAAGDVTAHECVATPTAPQIAAGIDVSSYYLKNADGNYVKCGATETAVEGKTYYELDPTKATAYVVKDANGKKLTVTVAAGLSIETEIAAEDATDGNAVSGNFAMFKPTVAGTYAFEYNDGAKKHYKIIIVH